MKTIIKVSFCFGLCLSASDYATAAVTSIVPVAPTTISPTPPVSPGNYTISGGQPFGTNNVLQTFTSFNLASPDTVTFANSASYSSLIVRVIGGASTIDGKLTSLIPNLYFINPAGVTFGANAAIDVPGTFHVSTADKMTFKGYSIDTHSTTPASELSIAPPDSFGFVGGSNSTVTFNNSSALSVLPGKVFDVVANNIDIGASNATATPTLSAPTGDMRLVAFKGTGDVSVDTAILPTLSQSATNGGNINIGHSAKSTCCRVNALGGEVSLWGADITVNNGNISANSTAAGTGHVTVVGNTLNIVNGGSITTSTGATSQSAGNIDIATNTLNIIGYTNLDVSQGKAGFTGISSSVVPASTGSGSNTGKITVNTNNLNIQNSGGIRSSTFKEKNAGTVNVTTNTLTISNQMPSKSTIIAGISTQSDGRGIAVKGNAGTVNVVAKDALTLTNGAQISSSSINKSSGNAGTVIVTAGSIVLDTKSNISSAATAGSIGHTGNVNVAASKSIQLLNGSKISIQSDANVPSVSPKHSLITVTAPDINMKDSAITSAATVDDDAGDITVNFDNLLTLKSSFIKTTANTGNGGTITINGGKAIYLENSGFLTSVSGRMSNGGNINVNAGVLAMNTAVIQANAVGGSGGDINIFLKALIASQNNLILGGPKVFWQPNIPGFNVIQAASESGVSGTVNVNSPQFDISGSVSGLNTSGLVLAGIAQNPCQSQGTRSSSLARGSKGGLPTIESKTGYIPAAGVSSGTQSSAEKITTNNSIVVADASKKAHQDYSCSPV